MLHNPPDRGSSAAGVEHGRLLVTVDPHLHRFEALAGVYTIPTTITQAALVIATWVAVEAHRPVRVSPDAKARSRFGLEQCLG